MIWRKKRESAKNSEMDLMLILFLYRAYYCTAGADEARKKVLLLSGEHAKIYIYRRLLWKKKK